MKTSELTGAALDWAVAKCLGETEDETLDPLTWVYTAKPTGCWDFSTKWSQGGPIIEREGIDIRWGRNQWIASLWADNSGMAKNHLQRFKHNIETSGETPLIAAMRCYVASKLGDEVEIPAELKAAT